MSAIFFSKYLFKVNNFVLSCNKTHFNATSKFSVHLIIYCIKKKKIDHLREQINCDIPEIELRIYSIRQTHSFHDISFVTETQEPCLG